MSICIPPDLPSRRFWSEINRLSEPNSETQNQVSKRANLMSNGIIFFALMSSLRQGCKPDLDAIGSALGINHGEGRKSRTR